jgi:hypothetical protein
MKLRRLLSLTALAGLTAGLMFLGPRPAVAEEEVGNQVQHDAEWGSLGYRVYQYPSTKNSFSFTPKSYVSFDVVNGKFFMLEHFRQDYETHASPGIAQVLPYISYPYPFALRYDAVKVSFFTPDLKPLHEFNEVRPYHKYSIPRDGNDYERIICRIENGDSIDNRSYKMRVWDEIDPVQAEPNEPGANGYDFNDVRN